MHKYKISDEMCSQSHHSPRVVSNDESLSRLDYSPEHIVDGRLIPAGIKTQDLTKRGFSVFRDLYVKKEQIRELAKSQMQRLPERRKNAYVAVIETGKVRATMYDQGKKERAFIVLDEALPTANSHATIYSAFRSQKGEVLKLKSLLVDMINRNLTNFPTK